MKNNKYIDILDSNHFILDIMYNPNTMGLGIQIGSTIFVGEKRDNLYIDFEVLFWTFGIEIKNIRS